MVAGRLRGRVLRAEVGVATRRCRRAALPRGAVVAGDASIPRSGRPATTTCGQTREPRSGWACPWLTCGPCRCLNLSTSIGGTRGKVEGGDRHDLEPEGVRKDTRHKIYTGSGSQSSYPTSYLE
jgi:hypothetical protein